MSSPPYMPFYIADYLADTQELTTLEHGAYMLIIMAMWRGGGVLQNDDKRLASIAKLSRPEWDEMAATVKAFFIKRGGLLTHKRVTQEYDKTLIKSKAASASSKKRWAKNKDIADPNADADEMPMQCENDANSELRTKKDIDKKGISNDIPKENENQDFDDWDIFGSPKPVASVPVVIVTPAMNGELIMPGDFEDFWSLYPRHIGKAAAKKSYEKLLKGGIASKQIMDGLNLWLENWRRMGTADEYKPHPATWLNQQRFFDDLKGEIESASRSKQFAPSANNGPDARAASMLTGLAAFAHR